MYCKLLLLLFIIGASPNVHNTYIPQNFNLIHNPNRDTQFGPKLQTGWYLTVDTSNYKRKHYKNSSDYFLDPVPIATAGDFKVMKIYKNQQGNFEMLIKLSKGAAIAWRNATKGRVDRKLAFILNDKLIEVDHINGETTNGSSTLIGNIYSESELKQIKQIIEKEKAKL